jgi:hypothetical protein
MLLCFEDVGGSSESGYNIDHRLSMLNPNQVIQSTQTNPFEAKKCQFQMREVTTWWTNDVWFCVK